MASDELLNNLFEIAQSEVDEILYFNDFSTELRNNFKELTNDEYDSALIAINEQVKNGNKLMEFSSGKISISNSIISKAVNTVEYEKRLKENYQRSLNENKINTEDIIITSVIFSQMMDKYTDLSSDEKNILWDNYSNFTREQQRELEDANINELNKISKQYEGTNIGNIAQSAENAAKSRQKVTDALFKQETKDSLKSKAIQLYIHNVVLQDKSFKSFLLSNYSEGNWENLSDKEILTLFDEFSGKRDLEFQQLVKEMENDLTTPEQDKSIEEYGQSRNEYNENLNKLIEIYPDIASEILLFSKKGKKEGEKNNINHTVDNISQTKSNKNSNIENIPAEVNILFSGFDDNQSAQEHVTKLESSLYNDNAEYQYSDTLVQNKSKIQDFDSEIQETISEDNLEGIVENKIEEQEFTEQDILDALSHYQEYFQDFDDEMIETMSEMTPEEIIANIKDDFDDMQNEGEITEESRKALDVMLGNITEETKDILLDPTKREAFFEKIQSDLESQKDTELIKDSELVEIFKQASVELEVGEITQGREDDIQDNSSPLENAHMDTEYIVNGVPMNIDEQWLQFFQDAQERGEDLEEAYENYKKEQEVEEIESKRAEERKEDKAQDEQEQEEVIVEEDGTIKQSAEEETELSAETLEVEGNEFFDLSDIDTLKKSKKSKRVAVVEKDEDGNLTNVQIFKPVEFLRQTEVTTHEFEETISELTALTVDKNTPEKENGDEEISQD